VLITGGFTPPMELVIEAERARVPLLKTTTPTPTAIAKLASILEDSLAERIILHAVLMDVLGLGVMLSGESGIGKSECALDLIVRGHRTGGRMTRSKCGGGRRRSSSAPVRS
jgi:HPr kinase/phosphorylase